MAEEYRRYDTGYSGAEVVELLGRVPRVDERVTMLEGRLGVLEEGGGDLHFEVNFYNRDSVRCVHGLGKRPSVTVVDGGGDVILADVRHVDVNTVVVGFGMSASGRLIFN